MINTKALVSAVCERTKLRKMVARWIARRWLAPGHSVIVDTETTDLHGMIIEIAVIDAATSKTLLHTLVNPHGTPIAEEAARVHGITATMCTTAPDWPHVAEQLATLTAGKRVLAWNADYDRAVIDQQQRHHELPPLRRSWRCAMKLDAWARAEKWRKLNGGHRALQDTHAARDALRAIAQS